MLIRLIFLLFFSVSIGAQVENFGSKSLLGRDYLDHLEGFLGGNSKCVKASNGEYRLVEDCVKNYSILRPDAVQDFDPLIEELIFLEAARRTHQLASCQVKLYDGLESRANAKSDLLNSAFDQFTDLQSKSLAEIQKLLSDEQSLASQKFAGISFAEDKGTQNGFQIQKKIAEGKERVGEDLQKIYDLVARVPLGNRPQMRKTLVDLLRKGRPISRDEFFVAYSETLNQLSHEAHSADQFMSKLQRRDSLGKGKIYSVDEDLKKSLTKSGQIQNVVSALGLGPQLTESFMCRAKARYDNGPTNLTIAEIPSYFLGGYGLGRLAARAGVGVIRASSAAAMTVARIELWASNLAMLGLESYAWARVGDQIREACIPQEFLTGVTDDNCTPETEISGLYQESLSASCITKAAIAVSPILLTNGLRLMKSFRPDAIAESKLTIPPKVEAPEIIVKAKPRKPASVQKTIEKYRELKLNRDTEILKKSYLKKNPTASEKEALEKARSAAIARREEAIALRKTCGSAKPSPEMVKAAKVFTTYSVAYGVGNTAISYSLANWNKVKDKKWAANLGFEVVMAYFLSRFNARMNTGSMKFGEKVIAGNIVAFRNNLIDAGVYGLFFSDDNKKVQKELDKLANSPTFKEDVDSLIAFTHQESGMNKMVDEIGDMSSNVFRIITGEETVRDLTPEELSKLSPDRLKDPVVQEQLMDLIVDKTYSDSVDGMTTGSKSLDRMGFNTGWSLGSVPVSMVLGALTFQAVCWNIHNPAAALAAFGAIQGSRQVGQGYLYYRTRRSVIGQ